MAKYRGGVVGVGWMGLLYDLAGRIGGDYSVDDVDRPTPELDVHRKFYHHDHPGSEGLPGSYAEALFHRPEVDLVAASERDPKRLKAFGERYSTDALYTDAAEMLQKEKLDIVAICTNVKGRADITCKAVECGAKAIFTEKPMCHTLEEADRMVKVCADAGVPLNCGAITTTHPSFAAAKKLVSDGEIGDVLSIEASPPGSQHQNFTYFVDSPPVWVIGYGDETEPDSSGSIEFRGEGMMATADGRIVHFRRHAPLIRITGTTGEILHDWQPTAWKLSRHVEGLPPRVKVEVPWPGPQIIGDYGGIYSLSDLIDCLDGKLDEPKNSGRRVAIALEVEIALKQSSAQGGVRVDLPLKDRSLGLRYSSFR
jgi:hypothetical protein